MQVTSTSYRAYALDLWGFGDTAHNPSNYSLEHQANLLKRFLDEMGIGKIALVGHGLGALVGMKFAAMSENKGLVDRLMAISCPLGDQDVNPRLRTATPKELTEWLSSRTPEAATALSDSPKADTKAAAESIVGAQANNIYSDFRALNIPCLLVYGDKDPAITTPDGEYSLSTMIHQIELESSGHFPMIDENTRFNRLLTDFLALDSGASPRDLQMKEEWRRRVR
jgi:pimeloyl-ACP methyl ester carboxylesterase